MIARKVKSVYEDIVILKLDKSARKAIEAVAKNKGIDVITVSNLLLHERLAQLHVL